MGRPRSAARRTPRPVPRTKSRWDQVVEGSPFERFVSAFGVAADVEPADAGTRVTLVVFQRLRGMSRFGGMLAKRGMAKQLDEALDGLEALL